MNRIFQSLRCWVSGIPPLTLRRTSGRRNNDHPTPACPPDVWRGTRHLKPYIVFLLGLFLLLGAGTVWSWTTAEELQFQEANELYREGRYDEAIVIYDDLVRIYPDEAILFYNLGNSYFRAGNIGKALLNYERALVLDPRHQDTRRNLDHVSGLLEYRVDDHRNWYVRTGEKVLGYFTEQEISILWLGSFFLFMAGWCFCLFFRRGAPWGWKRKALILLTILFVVLAAAKHFEKNVMVDAIVLADEAEFRYGPSDTDRVAFRLGEGHKVYMVDQRKDWSRIVLVNGEGGWVKSDQIAEVNA